MNTLHNPNPVESSEISDAKYTVLVPCIPQSSHTPRPLTWRFILFCAAFIAYVIGFIVIENHYGKGGPTAAVIMVVAAGWLFGFVPGMCAGLLSFFLNWIIYSHFGMAWESTLLGGGGVAGTIALTFIGATLGRMRDLSRRLSAELNERMRTERELRASKDQLEKLIETSLDPIVITDAAYAVIKPNRAFLDMIGYTEQEIAGKPLYQFSVTTEGTYESKTGESVSIGPDFFTYDIPLKITQLSENGKISNWETYYLNKDKKLIPVTQNIVWSYDGNGKHVSAFAIIRDITEQKKAELALVSSREAAIEANQFRTRFFTNITHEFRTPLTLAIGPLEGILRGEFGKIADEMQQQVSLALRNSRQLLKLVNQLLDFSMLESGGKALFLETKHPTQFTAAILNSFEGIAEQKNIQLCLRERSDIPPVPLDTGKVEKVLFNLIGNACKYTPAGGTITVSLEKTLRGVIAAGDTDTLITGTGGGTGSPFVLPDDYIKIAVSDTGVGIKPEHHKRIFERFQQTGERFAHEQGGSGLGLAYTKELVEMMGGHITLSSSPGQGSTFCIYLPAALGEPDQVSSAHTNDSSVIRLNPEVEMSDVLPDSTAPQENITGEKPLILIVDDNPDVRRYVAGIISNSYDYFCAGNGSEALTVMEKRLPDLIICDIMMPEMDGYELLRQVKAHAVWKSIPFVFLTAKADPAMKIEGLEEGADDYIVKPFNSLELLARVKSLLRLRQLLQETNSQKQEIINLSRKLEDRYSYGNIIGESPPMRRIYQILESIKDSDANVLITGETGTGKELVANAIHYMSSRKNMPFITVNCGAIPKELMEREFFGHVKGAYTGAIKDAKGFFQEADGGTLFLDEIGEMDKDLQVKLLRVLERGEFSRIGSSSYIKVNVRLIVATNKTLREEVLSGNFREDLYFRVNVIPIHLPPLRQRREDIPLLIDHFLETYKNKHKKEPLPFTQKDMNFFLNYSYPGNVRELQHMLERFWLMGGSAESVMEFERGGSSLADTDTVSKDSVLDNIESLKEAKIRIEKDIIINTLKKCNYNYSRAASILKISRVALYKKINQHRLKE